MSSAGWKQVVSAAVLDLPLVRGLVRREQERLVDKIRRDVAAKATRSAGPAAAFKALPARGLPAAEVRQRMDAKVRWVGCGEGCCQPTRMRATCLRRLPG